jgi:hypothetical protein
MSPAHSVNLPGSSDTGWDTSDALSSLGVDSQAIGASRDPASVGGIEEEVAGSRKQFSSSRTNFNLPVVLTGVKNGVPDVSPRFRRHAVVVDTSSHIDKSCSCGMTVDEDE